MQFVVPSGNQAQNSIPGPIIHTGETAVNPSGFQTNGSAASQNSNAQSGMTVGAHNSASGNASEPLDELSGGEALISPLTPISPLLQLASGIWIVGMIGYAGLLIINSLTLRHRLRYAMRVKQNIYECEAITSPFIYGLFHPKIYLPMDLDVRQRKYVLTHEQIHLRRYDYVFKMIGSLVLMFHWFNPILWYSYILMSKDMEMACDEAVVRRLGQNGRINYGMTLLQFASRPTITALSFSESNTKLRIKNILDSQFLQPICQTDIRCRIKFRQRQIDLKIFRIFPFPHRIHQFEHGIFLQNLIHRHAFVRKNQPHPAALI